MSEPIDIATVTHKLAALSLLRFFPQEPEARAAIVTIVCRMVSTVDQIDWLIKSALAVYDDWPGPRELRALFCSRWNPRDGVKAYSQIYPSDESGGGFPSSIYPASRFPALPPPREIKAIEQAPLAPASQAAIDLAVSVMRPMPKPLYLHDEFEQRLAEVLTPPLDRPVPPSPTPQIVTAEDVQRTVEELRAKRTDGV
jgi:hypothetical protein